MLKKLAILLAVLVPAIALAGGPVNPPGPTPITCTGGNSVVAYSGYGQPLTCGTGTATGTISTGVAGQLADYTAATTIGPITTGTGVVTALGVNTGSAGAFLVNGGVLGTPSSGTLTNATGLPIATGVSGLGANVAAFLATPSSANFAAALTTSTGTGVNVFNANPSLTTPTIAGATLSGTLAGTPTFSGNLTFSGRPIFSGVLTGTQVSCLGLDATNNLTVAGAACGSGGGGGITFTDGTHTVTGSTQLTVSGGTIGGVTPNATLAITGTSAGFGVDGGTSAASVTGTGSIGSAVRLVKIAAGWTTGTLTLPAISGVSADTAIEFDDAGSNVTGSATLTIAGVAATDGINGGAAGGSIGPFNSSGIKVTCRVSATHNWTCTSAIPAVAQVAHQWLNSLSAAGVWGQSQPGVADISGLGTGVATAAGAALSANGGLTTTIASGTAALATSAIASGVCAAAVTATATNTATTDVVLASFNGDPTAVTGYIPSTNGMLTIVVFPTANTANFRVCNNTSASITPGAITLNWRVVR